MLLSATVLYCQAAAAHKQRYHQDKTCGVDGETEVVHFTAAATQKEDDEQYPCAVSQTATTAATCIGSTGIFIVEQSVEHYCTSVYPSG